MSNNNHIGKVGVLPIDTLADKCAERIMASRNTWAVCIAPDGVVTLERYDEAVPDEIVGNYDRAAGRLNLWRMIRDDMRATVEELGGLQTVRRRYVMREGRRAA
jgi:hypothetical protein